MLSFATCLLCGDKNPQPGSLISRATDPSDQETPGIREQSEKYKTLNVSCLKVKVPPSYQYDLEDESKGVRPQIRDTQQCLSMYMDSKSMPGFSLEANGLLQLSRPYGREELFPSYRTWRLFLFKQVLPSVSPSRRRLPSPQVCFP